MTRALWAGIGVGALIFAAPAQATEWWYIGTAVNGENWLADRAGIQTQGSDSYVWVWTFAKAPNDKVQERKIRFGIACNSDYSKLTVEVDYDRSGNVLSSYNDILANYTPIVPDSMAEIVKAFACSTAAQWPPSFLGPIANPDQIFRAKAVPAAPQHRKRRTPTPKAP